MTRAEYIRRLVAAVRDGRSTATVYAPTTTAKHPVDRG